MLKVSIAQRIRLYFEIILLVQVVIIFYLQQYLYPIHFPQQYFFFIRLPVEVIVVINLFNTLLFWIIAKRFWRGYISLVPPAIYAVCPWGNYLSSMGSIYILSLFFVLLALCGLLVVPQRYRTKIVRLLGCAFIFLALVFLFLSKDVYDFPQALGREIGIFSDPGLINNVESYQVGAGRVGLGSISKLAENRYVFSAEYVFLKYVKNLSPSVFFTPQEKLLGSSFSPPIFFGFIFPFFWSIYLIIGSVALRKRLLVSTILVIPSLLSSKMVDLNRLITFSPVLIFVISYGLIAMFKQRKNRVLNTFLVVSVFLVIIQMIITFIDIGIREQDRYVKYFDDRFEIRQ